MMSLHYCLGSAGSKMNVSLAFLAHKVCPPHLENTENMPPSPMDTFWIHQDAPHSAFLVSCWEAKPGGREGVNGTWQGLKVLQAGTTQGECGQDLLQTRP